MMEAGKVIERGGSLISLDHCELHTLGYDELRTKPDGIFARMVTEQAIERRQSREAHHEEEDSDDSFEAIHVDDPGVDLITEQVGDFRFKLYS